jgi:hypothetical protein
VAETAAFAEAMGELCDGSPVLWNLDVAGVLER